MKNILRVFAVVLSVAALSGAATVAQAQTYSTTQNFNAASNGTAVQSSFDANFLTVAFAGLGAANQWEPDTSGSPLSVQGNAIGFGDGGFEDGPVIFETTLRQENIAYVFNAFTIDVVPGTSTFASTTATGFFQTLTGAFDANPFTFNQTIAGTLNLTALIPVNTVAIVLPGDARYDNVSLSVVTVPETGALPLAIGGLLALAGAIVVRHKK